MNPLAKCLEQQRVKGLRQRAVEMSDFAIKHFPPPKLPWNVKFPPAGKDRIGPAAPCPPSHASKDQRDPNEHNDVDLPASAQRHRWRSLSRPLNPGSSNGR